MLGALAMAGISLASSAMAEADGDDAMAQKASDYGVRKAGIESGKNTRLDGILTQASALIDNQQQAELIIDQTQAVSEAQARVNAAAAGVAGESVNQVIDETEVNAAKAKGVVEQQTQDAQNQLKQNYVDTVVNTDKSTGTLDTSSHNQGLKHVLAFASGFQAGFEPAPGTESDL